MNYETFVVVRAEPAVQTETGIVGWDVDLNVGGIWRTSEHCAETPRPGEQVRLYGPGLGYRITAITIGGRVYRGHDVIEAAP